MKTTILKMILPVAAFVLASAGAVSTAKSEKGAAVTYMGYQQVIHPTQPCFAVKECSDSGSQICTVNDTPTGIQLWGKEDNDVANPCNLTLYRP